MSILVISGSPRINSESARVGAFLVEMGQKLFPENAFELVELAKHSLPVFDTTSDFPTEISENLAFLREKLDLAEGFVFISPEYNGMVPSSLKNLFLHFNHQVFGHKPAMLVGVSSGFGGAFPVAELRTSSYKNSRICYIPEQVIVRHVKGLELKEIASETDSKDEIYLKKRLKYGLEILLEYTKALKSVRESGIINYLDFGNGMS